MKRFLFCCASIVFLFAGCGNDEPQVEEYVQDPKATAEETPDVSEPLGRPANDPASAVEAFILALRFDQDDNLREMVYPGEEGVRAPLLDTLDDLLAEPGISDWDELTVGGELPAGEGVLEKREVSVRLYRGGTSRVARFTVVRNSLGWYLWDLEE